LKKVIAEYGNKIIYETDNEDELLCKFTDDLVDARGNVKGTIKNKAAINGSIAVHLAKVLSSYHVPTFYKNQKSAKELTIKNAEVVPIIVTLTNETNDEGVNVPAITYESIADGSTSPIEVDEIVKQELFSEEELTDVRRYALKINVVLRNLFERRNLELLGFHFQFGFFNGKMIVCSELTPETCDLKEIGSRTKFTTTYLLSHLDNANELYEQVQQSILF
jgi:phosphoribosylaminoimidazole-succinocarboxamide synthase